MIVWWLVGCLRSSSTTKLYRGRVPRLTSANFYVLSNTRQSGEIMTSVSATHIILSSTQPVGSGRPQRGSNPGSLHQESRALPTELSPSPQDSLKASFNSRHVQSTVTLRKLQQRIDLGAGGEPWCEASSRAGQAG